MNATAHRSMVWASSPPPDPVPPTEPVDPDGPGPKPPPKIRSARALMALVSQGPEDTPGRFDPYVRRALERSMFAGVGSGPDLVPPRSAFLAAVVQEFTERMTELARTGGLDDIVACHVAPFVDEICGTGAPSEPRWYPAGFDAADLIAMGIQFEQCSASAADPDLGRTFSDAAHALLIAGATRLS
jgi:hypothetical protein